MPLPEFYRHTVPFQRALRAMTAAASQRDQRIATAYTSLVGAASSATGT